MIHVTRATLERIRLEARRSEDGLETGGVLMGFDPVGSRPLEIHRAAGPGPSAVREPTFFRRDLAFSVQLVDEAFADVGAAWVGDWHTHPRGPDAPSRLDLSTYEGFLRDPDLHLEVFCAFIVVPGSAGWHEPEISPWLISLRGGSARSVRGELEVLRLYALP